MSHSHQEHAREHSHPPHRHLPIPLLPKRLIPPLNRILLRQYPHKRRINQPRHHRIQPHAPLRIQHRRALRELYDRRLRRRVRDLRLADVAHPRHATDVDDNAAGGLIFHDGQHEVAEEVDGFEVHVCLLVPDLFAHFGRAARLAAPDVVDEEVYSPMLCYAGVDDGLDAGRGGRVAVHDIYGVRGGFSADLRGSALGGGEGDFASEEGGALSGEEVGDCGAVATACGHLRGGLLVGRVGGG